MLLSQFPRSYHRFVSLPLLGPIADGLDDWLTTRGYTRGSRQNSILRLPYVDAELRRRGVKQLADLTLPVLRDSWRSLRKAYPFSTRTVRALERYLVANSLIANVQQQPLFLPTRSLSESMHHTCSAFADLVLPPVYRNHTPP